MKKSVRVAVVILLALLSLPLTLWNSDVWEGTTYLEDPFGLGIINLTVVDVDPNSPAQAAGVRAGDVIDQQTLSLEGLAILWGDRETRAGNRISFRIVRGRTTRDVTLVARPPVPLPPGLLLSRWLRSTLRSFSSVSGRFSCSCGRV